MSIASLGLKQRCLSLQGCESRFEAKVPVPARVTELQDELQGQAPKYSAPQ
ncbi:hypothetical protein ACODM8_16535 [Vibrio ostreicida]|uniref:hypothetical protein n=1 Tax=Vibrio ostreicida TaxID=526588 RepID=UPI003B59A794